MINKTSSSVVVVDQKTLVKTTEAEEVKPDVKIYHIPQVAISITAKKLTYIRQIVNQVSLTYKNSEIIGIEIENFGSFEKVTAVVLESTKRKVDVEYLVNTKTKEVKFIEAVSVPEVVKGEYYS